MKIVSKKSEKIFCHRYLETTRWLETPENKNSLKKIRENLEKYKIYDKAITDLNDIS